MKKHLLILFSLLFFGISLSAQDNADARQVAEKSASERKDIISAT